MSDSTPPSAPPEHARLARPGPATGWLRWLPGLRALRTARSEGLEKEEQVSLGELGTILDLYFGGDMEASIALSGQVVGRIDAVRPVAEILHDTVREFEAIAGALAAFAAHE